MKLTFKPFMDTETELLGYGTWGKPGRTDAEVDAQYITMYYYYFNAISKNCPEFDYADNVFPYGYHKALTQFKTDTHGVYRRFPRPGLNQSKSLPEALFTNPCNLSRDNLTALIISLGEFGELDEAIDAYRQLLKRCSFFQNTHTYLGIKKSFPDLATPDHHGMYIRSIAQATNMTILNIVLYPILLICDIFGLASMILHALHSVFVRPDHTGSELNHIAICCQRARVIPTFIGRLANYVYSFRANMPQYGEKSAVMNSVFEFFTRGNRGNIMPPLDELCREAVGDYIDHKAIK